MITRKHPAKFNDAVLDMIVKVLTPYVIEHLQMEPYPFTVLDPFAGVGRVFEMEEPLGVECWGIEIEPEWISDHPHHLCGDAFAIMNKLAPHVDGCYILEVPDPVPVRFDAIVTSPTYGNRMADHHNAQDDSERHTYRHYLGRPLHPKNSGQLQWGGDYRKFHEIAWKLAVKLIRPGGLFVLNIKDHYRKKRLQPVTAFHMRTLVGLGMELVDSKFVPAKGMRQGENNEERTDGEWIKVFRKPMT